MPKKALKTLEKHLLYIKKKVWIYRNENDIDAHRTTTNATDPNRTDGNLTERIEIKREINHTNKKWICQ